MTPAKAAAGNQIMLVHGAYTAQRALAVGVLDELKIRQVSVLLSSGRPSPVRGVTVARRVGENPGDRYGGGHPYSPPHRSLSWSAT